MNRRTILGILVFALFVSGLITGVSYIDTNNTFWIVFSVVILIISLFIVSMCIPEKKCTQCATTFQPKYMMHFHEDGRILCDHCTKKNYLKMTIDKPNLCRCAWD